ncbi:hypothetical protein HDV06_003620 [Boothiomyces sp. JEL0866]|nr:hypothetical protein HDV06_003620 [Boothiomyces sp. JEL0866]
MSNKTQKLLKTHDILNRYELELYSRVPRKAKVEIEMIPPRHIIKVTNEIWNNFDDYATCKSSKLLPEQHEAYKLNIFDYKKPVKQKPLEYKVAEKLTKSTKLKSRSKYVGTVHSVPVRIVPKLHVIVQEEVHDDDFSISDNASSLGSFEKLVRELNSIETGIENQLAIFQCLVKTPIVDRSAMDVQNLFDYVRPLPAFAKMNDDLLKQVCVVARIDYFQNNEIVCQAEGLGNTWMVVLVGKCQIRKLTDLQNIKLSNYPPYYISQTTLVQHSTAVTIIDSGYEVCSLVKQKRNRDEVIIPLQDCVVLRLDLEEYSRIYYYVQEKTREHHLKLFEEIDFCSKMTKEDKITMSDFMTGKAYKRDEIIQNYGQSIEKMGLVVKGKCLAFANLPDGTMVKLGIFKLGEYFNEQLYFLPSKEQKSTSLFNIIALDDCEVGFFGAAELQSIIGKPIENSEISIISQNQSEILYLQKQEIQAKQWKNIRNRQILGLIKEWEGKPEALGKKWREQHKLTKPKKAAPLKKEIPAVKVEKSTPVVERPRSCLKRNTGSAGKRVVISVPDTNKS